MTATAAIPGETLPVRRRLRGFTGVGYDKGRGVLWQALWFATQNILFGAWWCPLRLRPVLLRAFGASVGERAFIRHRVRVLWPWKLTVGDDCWIGEDAWLLNLEPIVLGNDVCLSQGAFLCTGSHDRRSPTFEYDNGRIVIGDGVWVSARAVVLRGVTVEAAAVIPAGDVVRRDVMAVAPKFVTARRGVR
ncbi:MAG: DapH/DapD/GlmU-related protein [Frankiaceae bacterium]